jgi:hypothetical protein
MGSGLSGAPSTVPPDFQTGAQRDTAEGRIARKLTQTRKVA